MRKLINQINEWNSIDRPMALATVINTWGSAPRKIGSHMVIAENMEFVGSVSGGCVESAVIAAGLEVIKTERPALLSYGVSDDDAWEVGLACGGNIEIVVISMTDEIVDSINLMLEDEFTGSSKIEITKKNPHKITFSINNPEISNPNKIEQKEIIKFYNHYPPPLHLIIVGGSEIGIELSKIAKFHNYKVSIIDPRKVFTHDNRFEDGINIFDEWPNKIIGKKIKINNNSAVVSLSHDPKIDDVGLKLAVKANAFYVGALGSKKTHGKRLSRLSTSGLTQKQLHKINGPIGININAITPAEIAISIMAEIINTKNVRN